MNARADLPSPIHFTEQAAQRVRDLVVAQDNAELKLRIFVTGGGCSGFQYGFSFDETQNSDDTVVQRNGATLLIDALSYHYLVGATIDFVEGLQGSRFIIDNPNADTTCGCGSSFSA